jgi:uncharacterized membrane protein
LSILVLVSVPTALWAAHRHEVRWHRRTMTLLFLGALLIAGGFTLLPGRIMHRVGFGGCGVPEAVALSPTIRQRHRPAG